MSDISANVVVTNPRPIFTDSRTFRAIANGRIFIGKIDTDPTIPSNQITVYIENEDGSRVPVPQPLIINAAGKIVYNGQLVKIVTVQGHSMAIYDAYGSQVDYIANVLKYDPDRLEQRLAELDGESLVGGGTYDQIRASNVAGDQIKCIGRASKMDGGEGLFFLDITDTTSVDNGGTVLVDAAGRRWKRSHDGMANVLWFGPANDIADGFNRAFLTFDSVYVPAGKFIANSPIFIARDHLEVRCDEGAKLSVSGDFPFFVVPNQFTGQLFTVEHAEFTSETAGQGRGIGSGGDLIYLSHMHIKNCRFNQNLKYGIHGDMIGCYVVKCLFGTIGPSKGNFQAIRSLGSIGQAETNINTFVACEFKGASGSSYVVQIDNGIKQIFEKCIFEQNANTEGLIRITGQYYPEFKSCWFEVNNTKSMVQLGIRGGIDALMLVIDGCYIDSNIPYTTSVIDWGDTVNKNAQITNNIFSRGTGVLFSDNSYAVVSYGNYSTTTGISFTTRKTQLAQLDVLDSQGINTPQIKVSNNITATAGNQIRGVYTIASTGVTSTTTDIAIQAGLGGGIAIVRGSIGTGVAFTKMYLIAIKRSGGSGNDVETILVSTIPSSITGDVTFDNNNGFLRMNRGTIAGGSINLTVLGL